MLETNILKNIGEKSFYLGGFFLASALPISSLFFLISIFISFLDKSIIPFKDQYNLILLISGSLMISKNILINLSENLISQNVRTTMWLDLINWIPFFVLFLASQKYLSTISQRINFSKLIIAGSIPVFISFILQAWFNLYGPYETLYGLIIWFQKPIEANHTGIAGLFSNQNYAGIWLTSILPFLIAERRQSKFKLFLFCLIILDIYFIFLTTSKNAFLGLIIILFILYGFRSKVFNYICFSLTSFFIAINFLSRINFLSGVNFQNINLTEFHIFEKIISFNFFNSSRFEIFKISLRLISEKPFWGWGKSLFPDKFISYGGNYFVEHTHSMPLEIAFNYGIPVSILLIGFTFLLLYKSWSKTNLFFAKNNSDFINKCWITSTLIIAISHINDITYYDGKISTFVWILLAGTKCIISNNENYKVVEK